MVDILLVLLVFFIVTWNFAISENELDIKIPTASKAKDPQPFVGQVVVNIKADGTIVMNHKEFTPEALRAKLQDLSKLYPEQAVILRGDQRTNYKFIMNVLDVCRAANIFNVVFAASSAE